MGLLTEIILNNGSSFKIEPDGIVVFVGPNNAGKSQSLKDIYSLLETDKASTVTISSIMIDKPSEEDLRKSMQRHCKLVENENISKYQMHNCNFNIYEFGSYSRNKTLGSARPFLASYLNTEERLRLANPPQQISRNDVKTHPIHYAAQMPTYRKKLSSYFERAFGQHLVPNILYGAKVPLCIGEAVPLSGDFDDNQECIEAYAEILDSYPQVQDQGDGMRSFVGILLNLMLENYELFLIDEPESFLHPPQAKIIGEIIGDLAGAGKQVVISTHSKDVVRGLIEANAERVTIVRVTRDGRDNNFSILENNEVKAIWDDPLLRYSDIMDSMFHESVVLCESDSDCKMYSIVFEQLKNEKGVFSQTQFIHCGGKTRMADVCAALKALGMKYRVIPDIDVLNNSKTLKKIIESCGGDWDAVEVDYKTIYSQVTQNKAEHILRSDLSDLLSKSSDKYLSKEEVRAIAGYVTTTGPWANIKKSGSTALPRGEATGSFERINAYLKGLGIHIVSEGELESFVPTVGGHGPKWVNGVLDKYPDLNDDAYKKIKSFVGSWGL